MTPPDDNPAERPAQGGKAFGVPAGGTVDHAALEPLGRPGSSNPATT